MCPDEDQLCLTEFRLFPNLLSRLIFVTGVTAFLVWAGRHVAHHAAPILLGVCRKSRQEKLQEYSLWFAVKNRPLIMYFNPELNSIFIGCDDLIHLL